MDEKTVMCSMSVVAANPQRDITNSAPLSF